MNNLTIGSTLGVNFAPIICLILTLGIIIYLIYSGLLPFTFKVDD